MIGSKQAFAFFTITGLVAAIATPYAANAARLGNNPDIRDQWFGVMTFDEEDSDDGDSGEELETLLRFTRQDRSGKLGGFLSFVDGDAGETDPMAFGTAKRRNQSPTSMVDRRGRVRVNLGSRREGFILRYALQADSTRNPSELEGRWAFSSEDGDLSGDAFFTNDEDDFDDDDNF